MTRLLRVLSYFLSYMSVEIKKVVSRSDLRKFIRFNYHLYRDNNYFVPELYPDMVNTLSKTRNPAFEFCEADYFLAYKGGRLVGRVAAIINCRANDRWNVRAVRFGWIDFIDDTEVSEALISAVAKWGKERGMTQITGPLGFTDFDPEGTLVEGFDQLGTMSTTYNYPYYASHFERLGFVKDADWVEYKVYVPDAIPEKHLRISDVVKRKYGLQVRKYKSARRLVNDYGQKIFDLMNVAYKDLYGYSELTPKQISLYIKTYLPMLDLDMVTLITEADGTLVGVGITMPSLSRALQKAKGRLFPFGWWHLLRALFMSKPQIIDFLLVAIRPDYQGKGANALLFSDLIPVYQRKGVKFAETNPELDMNHKVQSQWFYFDYVQHKRRRSYTKPID